MLVDFESFENFDRVRWHLGSYERNPVEMIIICKEFAKKNDSHRRKKFTQL